MKNIHLVKTGNIRPTILFFKSKGIPVEKLMGLSKLPMSVLNANDDEPMPVHAFWHFVQLCGDASKEDDLGFQLVSDQGMAVIQKIADKAIAEAITLHDAITILVKLISTYSTHAKYWLDRKDDGIWFTGGKVEVDDLEFHLMEQIALSNLICFVRHYLGTNWQPNAIRLQQSKNLTVAKRNYSKSLVVANQDVTAIFIDNRELGTCHPELLSLYEDLELLKSNSFQQKLYLAIKPYFGEGLPSLQQLAEILGLSLRQIQRRLSKEGVTFRHVLHKLSFDIAKEELIHSDKKIIDIAADLGYSDKSHFNRAFHQWSGMAPSVYREKMLQESK